MRLVVETSSSSLSSVISYEFVGGVGAGAAVGIKGLEVDGGAPAGWVVEKDVGRGSRCGEVAIVVQNLIQVCSRAEERFAFQELREAAAVFDGCGLAVREGRRKSRWTRIRGRGKRCTGWWGCMVGACGGTYNESKCHDK